jgi:hypothetical protein
MRRSFVLGPYLALTLMAARPASASAVFPEAVQAAVPGLPCVPQCTLCHQKNPGMAPASKPFAMNLKMASSVSQRDTASLTKALQALQAAGNASDADADGKGDYLELSDGEDPNSAEVGAALCVTTPLYGCGASSIAKAPHNKAMDPAAAVAGALSVVVGLLLARRRR